MKLLFLDVLLLFGSDKIIAVEAVNKVKICNKTKVVELVFELERSEFHDLAEFDKRGS